MVPETLIANSDLVLVPLYRNPPTRVAASPVCLRSRLGHFARVVQNWLQQMHNTCRDDLKVSVSPELAITNGCLQTLSIGDEARWTEKTAAAWI